VIEFLADRTVKQFLAGTHRACGPGETLRRIEPLLPRMGITRLADVTWLDDIGVAVFQAIRPNARTLSVSQGKGLSRELAKVSAAMEAIEVWHAERTVSAFAATVGEMTAGLGYRIDELDLSVRHHLNDGLRLEWSHAIGIGDQHADFVPTAYIRLDARAGPYWAPRLFKTSSNGLASGNTLEEALLHGLYEVIERDALSSEPQGVDPATAPGEAGLVLERMLAAHLEVQIDLFASPTGLPCFRALIWGETFPVWFAGYGCHLDTDVALCRALTEAAQSRATAIAGTRDDLSPLTYQLAKMITLRPDHGTGHTVSFQDVESIVTSDFDEDLRLVVDRVTTYTGRQPLAVHHTLADLGIPVVTVVCPGLHSHLEER
jgi:ribosomal protein S12 methylthiotransferase accessory factor